MADQLIIDALDDARKCDAENEVEALAKVKEASPPDTPWDEIEAWRKQLHKDFDRALEETDLPERPDYERVNDFLMKARRLAVEEGLP